MSEMYEEVKKSLEEVIEARKAIAKKRSKKPVYTYNAQLQEVIDGDTYKLLVDLGFGVHYSIHIRIRGINTVEIYGEDKEEGFEVADYVRAMFERSKKIVIETQYIRSFKRYQGDVYLDDIDLAEHLLAEGMAELSEG